MKATGIVRKVDELGRIVLPIELRRLYGIAEHDPVAIFVDGDCIILKKHQPGCVLCGETNDNIVVSGLRFCRRCAGEIAQKYSNGPCVQTDDGEEG